MKRVVKRLAIMLASTVYVGLLFLTAFAFQIRYTIGNPQVIKSWLAESGIYTSYVEEKAKDLDIQQISETSTIDLAGSDIVSAATGGFGEEVIRESAEKVIDGTYAWLRGDTASPEFTIDLSTAKAAFATNLANQVGAKLGTLPACEEAGKFSTQAFDIFSADCIPKGVDVNAKLTEFARDINNSSDLLPQKQFTGDDIKLDNGSGGKDTIGNVFPWIPRVYKAIVWAPWGLLAFSVLTILALIFLSTTRRRGVKRVAGGLVFVSVILLITGVALGPLSVRLNATFSKTVGDSASFNQAVIDPLMTQISQTFSRYDLIIGGSCLILALLFYAGLLLTRQGSHEQIPHEETILEAHEPEQQEPAYIFEKPEQPQATQAQTTQQAPLVPLPEQERTRQESNTIVSTPQQAPLQPRITARPASRPVTRRTSRIQG